jgi:hypothetical protein
VTIIEVEDKIRYACRRWQARELVADRTGGRQFADFGRRRSADIVEFFSGVGHINRMRPDGLSAERARMTSATVRFYEAVVNGAISRRPAARPTSRQLRHP